MAVSEPAPVINMSLEFSNSTTFASVTVSKILKPSSRLGCRGSVSQ